MPIERPDGAIPVIEPSNALVRIGDPIELASSAGGRLLVARAGESHFTLAGDRMQFVAEEDHRRNAQRLAIPISLNWRHPLIGLPYAQVIRYAELDGSGRSGPIAMHTLLFQQHGSLPVISLAMSDGALFDPDSGLMVVGNGIFHAPEKVLKAEYRDPRWWKYPGNFHMRGKEWERHADLQFIDSLGREVIQTKARVRINGQMTRSFPQHALRLGFPAELNTDLFGERVGAGYSALVLRTAGNDQIKGMLRDAYLHDLCKGLPFEVSASRTCVVYINGTYWGVHHLRHRMDEEEIARRYGIAKKHITILEDEARLYRGDTMQVVHFERLATRTANWDGRDRAWSDTLHARLDVDGFLAYMATQMILGNVDWPSQNVKYWRYSGKARQEAPLDGRWYFIMGDCDLAFGVYGNASTDMFDRVNALDVPITRLFKGMMKDPELRSRFVRIARDLAQGPFGAQRAVDRLDSMVAVMRPEMDRHTTRWRRPANVPSWEREVEVIRTFARDREAHVIRQLDQYERR